MKKILLVSFVMEANPQQPVTMAFEDTTALFNYRDEHKREILAFTVREIQYVEQPKSFE